MLMWTKRGRAAVLAVFALVVFVVFVAPIATVVGAAFAGQWTGPLPSNLGFANFGRALSGEQAASLSVSLQTALLAGAVSLILGTWAALASRAAPGWWRRCTDAVFHLPVAIPSVAIGLGVLIAFNERPVLLGGTKWIVILAHSVLVLAYAFSAVAAALDRLDPGYREAAESLGASPVRVLCQVTLPLLLPALGAPPDSPSRCPWASSAPPSWSTRPPGRRCRSASSRKPIAARSSTPPRAPRCSSSSPSSP